MFKRVTDISSSIKLITCLCLNVFLNHHPKIVEEEIWNQENRKIKKLQLGMKFAI